MVLAGECIVVMTQQPEWECQNVKAFGGLL